MTSLTSFRQAAETLFSLRGAWAFDAWQSINIRFWDYSLNPGAILWGMTSGYDIGKYTPSNNTITLHEALTSDDFTKKARKSWGLYAESFGMGIALGVLLHESMHQAHYQQGIAYPLNRKGHPEPHHNSHWIAECQRIGDLIGITPRLWPLYVERKEHAEDVRARLLKAHHQDSQQPHPSTLSGNQINNRRRWIWVPTIDGNEIMPVVDDLGHATYFGQLIATTEEITRFPQASFSHQGITPTASLSFILPPRP